MDNDEDYVVISGRDIPGYRDAAGTGTTPEERRPAHKLSPHPKPYTRAYIEMLHAINDKWRASEEPQAKTEIRSGEGPEPAYLSDIDPFVDSIANDLWPVNKAIHDNPELGYREYFAHKTLTKCMRSRAGWKVTPSAYGLETAWIAVYDSGRKGPVVSFNAEMGVFSSPCFPYPLYAKI